MGKNSKAKSMNVTVVLNKKTGRILYAEAGKDFVDLLFSFLLLPTATVTQLLSESGVPDSVGCIANLYDSVDELKSAFMTADKSMLLEPKIPSIAPNNLLRIQTPPATYYVCSSVGSYGIPIVKHCINSEAGKSCTCGRTTDIEMQMADTSSPEPPSTTGGGGYVKETATFIITDDLKVTPTSATTGLALLNEHGVQNLRELEERRLTVGYKQALGLLRASLFSATALTDAFSDQFKGDVYRASKCFPSEGDSSAPPDGIAVPSDMEDV